MNELALSPDVKNKLVSWEDHISYYLQLTETANAFSWQKADVLLNLVETFGNRSMEKIANDIGEPRSTVVNYVRTSKAFNAEARDPMASFTHHFQASFADSYSEKDGKFDTNKRFEWLSKAVDDNLSTRRLKEQVKEAKEVDYRTTSGNEDSLLKEIVPNATKWIFYSVGQKGKARSLWLCPESVSKILKFIEEYK